MSEAKKELMTFGLMIDRVNRYNTESIVVRAMTRRPGDKHPLNPSSTPFNSFDENVPKSHVGLCLSGVILRAWLYESSDGTEPRVHGGDEATVAEIYAMNEREAEAYLKTLRRVNRAIAKERDGRRLYNMPWRFSKSVGAFAKGIGATWFAVPDSEGFSSYQDTTWQWLDIGAAARQADAYERQLLDEAKARRAA